MVGMEDFFKDAPIGINAENTSAEAPIKVLLNRFPCIGSMGSLKAAHKASTGNTRVSLSWFSNEYGSFPVRMSYKKVPWVRDMWDGLYNSFKKTDLYSSWKEEEALHRQKSDGGELEKPMVIVFQWPKWKLCCMHNCESKKFGGSWYSVAASKDEDCLKIYRSLKDGESFVIEPFEQLLSSITWSI